MFRIVLGSSIALVSAAAALAQGVPAVMPGGLPPAIRPAVMAAHSSAKTEAFADLSLDHREKVQGIVDAFDQGQISSVRDAAAQIDAVLSPGEVRMVLADRQKMRVTLQHSGSARTPAVGSPGAVHDASFGGPSFAGGSSGGMRGGDRPGADAGRFLLNVSAMPNLLQTARSRDRLAGASAALH